MSRASQDDPIRILIVEDDEGDALLVEAMLEDTGVAVTLTRARSVDEALSMLDVDCILLDLGLPDSVGISGVLRIQETPSPPALVVFTGMTGADLGIEAVAAGAQDYLVKHEVGPDLLIRAVRYAVQRRFSDEQERTIYRNTVRARETARLERALLPTPALVDPHLAVHVGYLPGGDGLLGGDFYDVVERADGTVAAVIGDVAGHGPAEAALGATLRTAWRTLVLADTRDDLILPLVERVMINERSKPETFTTLCQLVLAADRRSADLYLAGHHAPIKLGAQATEIEATARGRALGIPVDSPWRAQRLELEDTWWLMLYTDGLLEATVLDRATVLADIRTGTVTVRLPRPRIGIAGLLEAVSAEYVLGTDGLPERILRRVHELHGGRLADDAAVLILGWPSRDDGGAARRSSTLADSAEWG